MTRGEANNYYPHLMASKIGVSGDSTGSTTLDFIEGALLSTHCPVFAIIKYNGGDLSAVVIEIYSDAYSISDITPLGDLNSSYTNLVKTFLKKPSSGDAGAIMTVDVTTAASNPPGALFDVYIYGIELKST